MIVQNHDITVYINLIRIIIEVYGALENQYRKRIFVNSMKEEIRKEKFYYKIIVSLKEK
jgi:hypothetical protein